MAIAAEGSSFDAGYRTVLGLEGGFLVAERHVRPSRQALPRLRPARREDQDRRPHRPPHVFLPALPAADWPARTIGDEVCVSDCSN